MQKQADRNAIKQHTRIYLRGHTWWIYYRENGETHRYSLRTQSRAEAEALQRHTEGELLLARHGPVRRRMPVEEYRTAFAAWVRNERRPATASKYDWAMRHWFSAVPRTYLDEYRPADAETFKATMLKRSLAPASVNIALRHVKAMFSRAEQWELIERNPFRRCAMLRVARAVPAFLTREQVERLLERLAERPPYDLIVCLTALCGFRRNEMFNARWEWFDWHARTVTLQSDSGFRLKDWEARTVPLSSWALAILRPRRRSSGHVIEWTKTTHPERGSEFWSYATWRSLVEAAGVPGVTLQQLRSTFGSLYLQQGVSLSKIALWMGHSSEDVTRRHYAALMAYDEDIERLK